MQGATNKQKLPVDGKDKKFESVCWLVMHHWPLGEHSEQILSSQTLAALYLGIFNDHTWDKCLDGAWTSSGSPLILIHIQIYI